jgi:hypothetical protein
MLDRSPVMTVRHLAAALEVWRYSEDSVRCVFGDKTGHPLADDIMDLLRKSPNGASRSEIRDMVGVRVPADRIGQVLELLARAGLARHERRDTGGRPAELWFAMTGLRRG